ERLDRIGDRRGVGIEFPGQIINQLADLDLLSGPGAAVELQAILTVHILSGEKNVHPCQWKVEFHGAGREDDALLWLPFPGGRGLPFPGGRAFQGAPERDFWRRTKSPGCAGRLAYLRLDRSREAPLLDAALDPHVLERQLWQVDARKQAICELLRTRLFPLLHAGVEPEAGIA